MQLHTKIPKIADFYLTISRENPYSQPEIVTIDQGYPEQTAADEMERNLDRTNMWISNCDQKASFLLALVGVVITVIFTSGVTPRVIQTLVNPFIDYCKDGVGSFCFWRTMDALLLVSGLVLIFLSMILQYTKKDYVIIEEFLDGIEFGAQAFVYEGEVYFVMPHSDEVYHGSTGVPIGHSVPLDDTLSAYAKSIEEESIKAIKALDINNTAVNIDFMLVGDKPYILEVGARCGATGLAELVSLRYGIDYYEIMLKAALGSLDVNELCKIEPLCAATILLVTSDIAGFIKSYKRPEGKHIYDFSLDYQVGDRVNAFRIGPDRIGQVITFADSVVESKRLAEDAIEQIDLKIEEMPTVKRLQPTNGGGKFCVFCLPYTEPHAKTA